MKQYLVTCTYTCKAKVFGPDCHPDDEDDGSCDDQEANETATETLSELSGPASSDHVQPQTVADKRLRRLSLQSSKWSDHTTASTASTRSTSSSGSKTDKEIDDLAREIKEALALAGSKPNEKQIEIKENKSNQNVKALKLQVQKPPEKLNATKELPIHATWPLLVESLGNRGAQYCPIISY